MITFEVDDIRDMNARIKRFLDYLEEFDVDDDDVFYSRLISCELITNALRHCGGTACFSGMIKDGDIVITVRSSSNCAHLKIPDLPDVLKESGRGLYIINAISGGNVVFSGGDVKVTLKKS